MTTREWLKPGLVGALAGAVAVAVAGLSGAGWMTAAGATRQGQMMADAQVVAALVPVCVARAETGPDRIAKVTAVLPATTVTRQNDAVLLAGWATVEGDAPASRTLAEACIAELRLRRGGLQGLAEQAG